MSGLGPTATSGHVKQRQRQRRRLHDSHCGLIRCQVWRKNLRRPACWSRRMQSQCPGLVWPDPVLDLSSYSLSDTWPVELGVYVLIWCVTHQGTICLIPGLSGTRPVRVWPVQLPAEAGLRQRRCCDNVGASSASTSTGAGSASSVCGVCGLYGRGICVSVGLYGRVYLWKIARYAFVGAGVACVSLVDWFVVAVWARMFA